MNTTEFSLFIKTAAALMAAYEISPDTFVRNRDREELASSALIGAKVMVQEYRKFKKEF